MYIFFLVEGTSENTNQDENISDDKHFVLSLLPMLSTLPMDKKLKTRIAIETLLYNITFPDLNTSENIHDAQQNTTENSSNNIGILTMDEDNHNITKTEDTVVKI